MVPVTMAWTSPEHSLTWETAQWVFHIHQSLPDIGCRYHHPHFTDGKLEFLEVKGHSQYPHQELKPAYESSFLSPEPLYGGDPESLVYLSGELLLLMVSHKLLFL